MYVLDWIGCTWQQRLKVWYGSEMTRWGKSSRKGGIGKKTKYSEVRGDELEGIKVQLSEVDG